MENPSKDSKKLLGEYFERAWGQALTTVSAAEEEVGKLVQKFSGAAGWGQEEMKRQVRELTERLQGQRKDLEKTVEDRVKVLVDGLRVPRRDQLQDVSRRLDALAERLEKLTSKRP